ncbi:DUF7017 domain-containing protein [Nitritalea halalkaliphila]|nr:hypothetical protein [Nitritalea halalkaliphila]
MKKCAQGGEQEKALHFLREFDLMQMPADEVLLHERIDYLRQVVRGEYLRVKSLVEQGHYAAAFELLIEQHDVHEEQLSWCMFYLFRQFNKEENPDWATLFGYFETFRTHVPAKKTLVFKLILQQLIKVPAEEWDTVSQVDAIHYLLGFEQLEEEDYQGQLYEGKKIMALAERLHIVYSKALLRESPPDEVILAYITQVVEPKLEIHPHMLYVPYFKAKLLLALGDRESGLRAFKHFALRKAKEFWVWQVYAEAYEDDPELYFACLCKALLCSTKPAFLLGIRERLMNFLVLQGRYAEAKYELEQIVAVRQKEQWGLRQQHKELLASPWFTTTPSRATAYTAAAVPAEALLDEEDIRAVQVVITYVNESKKLFGFTDTERQQGFGKYKKMPEVGQVYVLKGKFSEGNSGYFQVRALRLSECQEHPLLKQVADTFTPVQGKAFGFVGKVFVEPSFLNLHPLQPGQQVTGLAMLAPVKGKSAWGWKLIRLTDSVE